MKKPKVRHTKAEISQRRQIVMNLMLSGASRGFIIESVCLKYGCSDRTVDSDMATCQQYFRDKFAKSIGDKISEYDAKMQFLYERAVAFNELGVAFKILEYLRNASASGAVTDTDDQDNLKPINIFQAIRNEQRK